MAQGIVVKIHGLDELKRKLNPAFAGKPARNFLNRGAILIQNGGREFSPVYRGRLKNSISFQVDSSSVPLWARIGPNVQIYGEAQEFGTRPFWPPKAPLELWGQRKGLTPRQVFLVRRKISQVGIKPKHYMQQGVDQARPRIEALVPVFASELEAAAVAYGGGA